VESNLECHHCKAAAEEVAFVDGKFEFACAAHTAAQAVPVGEVPRHMTLDNDLVKRLVDNVNLARREAEMLREHVPKRFFAVDDGGCEYSIVAADLEHAKHLLRSAGVEFTVDDEANDDFGITVPIDDPRASGVEWTEISHERAATTRVALGDDGAPPVAMLSECKVGDWFSSEF